MQVAPRRGRGTRVFGPARNVAPFAHSDHPTAVSPENLCARVDSRRAWSGRSPVPSRRHCEAVSSVSFQRLSHRSRRLAESAWQSFSRFNTLIIARASPYWAPRRKSWLVGVNARTRWSICIRFRARLVIQRIAQPSDRDHAECAKVGAQRTSETTVTAPIFKRSVVGCPERHPKTSKPSRRCLRARDVALRRGSPMDRPEIVSNYPPRRSHGIAQIAIIQTGGDWCK